MFITIGENNIYDCSSKDDNRIPLLKRISLEKDINRNKNEFFDNCSFIKKLITKNDNKTNEYCKDLSKENLKNFSKRIINPPATKDLNNPNEKFYEMKIILIIIQIFVQIF